MTEQTPLGSPDPESVKQFLNGTAGTTLDIEPETVRDLHAETAPEDRRASVPLSNVASSDTPSATSIMKWAMTLPDVGDVEVTDDEKALFLKTLLNDVVFVLPITLSLGNTACVIECRALTTWETDVVFGALNLDEKDDKFRDIAQYTTALQQYMVALQLVKYNDTRVDPIPLKHESLAEDIRILRALTSHHIGSWSSIKWSMVLLAIRLFTIKVKLCTDAALNRDFWMPPGTD